MPISRHEIIKYFEQQGISVAGVITPADPYLDDSESSGVGPAFQTIYKPLMERREQLGSPLNLRDYSSEDTLNYLFSDLQWVRATHMLVTSRTNEPGSPLNRLGLRLGSRKEELEGEPQFYAVIKWWH
jgi:hypothetical protein